MKKNQSRGEGRGIGSFNGPDPKLQVKIKPELRDRIAQRANGLGIPVPDYVRYCILKDLEELI